MTPHPAPLGGLAATVLAQGLGRPGDERELAHAGVGLGRVHVQPAALAALERPAHSERGGLEVDVVPAERERLTLAETDT